MRVRLVLCRLGLMLRMWLEKVGWFKVKLGVVCVMEDVEGDVGLLESFVVYICWMVRCVMENEGSIMNVEL